MKKRYMQEVVQMELTAAELDTVLMALSLGEGRARRVLPLFEGVKVHDLVLKLSAQEEEQHNRWLEAQKIDNAAWVTKVVSGS